MKKTILLLLATWVVSLALYSATVDYLKLKSADITPSVINDIRNSNQRVLGPSFNFPTIPFEIPTAGDPLFVEHTPWTKNFAPYVVNPGGGQLYFYYSIPEHFIITQDLVNPLLVTFTPNDGHWNGSELMIVTISDAPLESGMGSFSTSIMKITITGTPDSPILSFGAGFPPSFPEDTTMTIDFRNYIQCIDSAPDNFNLFLAHTLPAPYNIDVIQNPTFTGSVVTFAPVQDFFGTVNLVLTAVDRSSSAIADTVITVTVTPVTDPPIIDSYLPVNTNLSLTQHATQAFSVVGHDVDGPSLNYIWRISGTFNGVPFMNVFSSLANASYDFDYPGVYTIECQAFDGGLSDYQSWNVTVSPIGPIFNPWGGVFHSTTSVSLTAPAQFPTAQIYYTLDGSIPSQSSLLYNPLTPIQIAAIPNNDHQMTIKAVYYVVGLPPSEVMSQDYLITGTVANPVFSLTPIPRYYEAQNVSLSTVTNGAQIYYTIDGTNPVIDAPNTFLYNLPIHIPVETVREIRAIAVKDHWLSSNIVSATYTITNIVHVLNYEFNPSPGDYDVPLDQTLEVLINNIILSPAEAVLRYTTDNSIPIETSPIYHALDEIVMTAPTTIRIRAFYPNWQPSDIISVVYNLFGQEIISSYPLPNGTIFNPAPGTFTTERYVSLNNTFPAGGTVYYTVDGTDPTNTHGALYAGPILVTSSTVIKARAYHSLMRPSPIYQGVFTITGKVARPVFAPAAGTYSSPEDITISSQPGASIYYSLDGNDPVIGAPNTTLYTTPVTVPWGVTTLKAKAFLESWDDSDIRTGTYFVSILPTPIFNYPSGTYQDVLPVRLSIIDAPGAQIYYTTDGSAPINGVNLYNDANPIMLPLNSTTTVRARAFLAGWNPSEIAERTYVITGSVSNPQFAPPAGEYPSSRLVSIISTTPGATIRYTTNGINPTVDYGTIYTDPILVETGISFKAIAYKDTWTPSQVVTSTYTIQGTVSAPVFTPPAGTYVNPVTVYLNTSTPDAVIRYTIDGVTTPSSTVGILYSSQNPILVNSSITIKAIAYVPGGNSSPVSQADYVITGIVASPTFNPVAGEYAAAQTVHINTATNGATIRYTTNGDEPSETVGNIYNPAIPLSIVQSTTVKAIAYKAGWLPSPVASAIYQINGAVSNPIFSPIAGSYSAAQTITISAFPTNATIRYTTDGSIPTTLTGTVYTVPFLVDRGTTINAIAYQNNWLSSGVSNATYSFNVLTPQINPPSGIYAEPQTVTIVNQTAGATVRYTTDGTDPTAINGQNYIGSFAVNTNTTVKAFAIRDGWNNSPIVFANYIVNGAVSVPEISVASGTYYSSFNVQITAFPADATIRYTTDGSIPSEVNGTIYNGQVLINKSTIIKAFAYKAMWQNSPVAQANYTLKATNPVISPASGSYNESQFITLNTTTPGAYIRYTTNGTIPSSTVGTLYTGSFEINTNLTLKAIAYKTDWSDSDVSESNYLFNVAVPVFNPPAGNFAMAQNVSITSATANAQIRYTLDGTEPTETVGTLYAGEFTIGAATTLRAIAYKANWVSSPLTSGLYTFSVAAPVFNPPAGNYASPQNVVLSTNTPGASIRYTIDGSIPDGINGIPYTIPISVNAATNLKAIAYKAGWVDSNVESATYQFNVETPLFNPPAGLFTTTQSVVITSTTAGAEIRYTDNGTTPSPTIGTLYTTPIVIPVNTTKIIKAIAFKTGWENSSVAEGGYIVTGTVAINGPIFDILSGTYQSPQTVSIIGVPAPADAVIRYTTDGTDPVETSTQYTVPINIPLASSITVKVRAFKASWIPSAIYSQTYTITGQVVLQTPMFSPAAGPYEYAQFVTLNTNTIPAGAILHYTVDGTIPTEASPVYNSPIETPLGTTTILSVRGFKNDWIPSLTQTATYQISSQVTFNSPVFSPPSGAYATQQLATINTTNPANAIVRYTTDGTDPTIASAQYTVPIVVPGNTAMIIKARAYAVGFTPSNIVTAVYNANILPVPQFTPESGTYNVSQNIGISVPVENATIYYTLDGTDPDASSNLYTTPIQSGLNTTVLIKAKAYKAGWGPSQTATATYIVTGQVAGVSFNPAGGIYTSGQNVVLTTSTVGATIRYTTNGSVPDETSSVFTTALNIPLNTTRTIKAIAYKNSWIPSALSSETYNITGQVALSTLAFSINPGTYQTAQSVAVTGLPEPSNAIVRFTTDGSDPTVLSEVYSNPIAVPLNTITQIKVRAFKADWIASPVMAGTYNVTGQIVLSDPLFLPVPGVYQEAQTIVIDTDTVPAGATIRFTTDGSLPTENSFAYTNPIQLPLNTSTTLRVRAFKNDWLPSVVISGVYQITGQVTLNLPVFSPQAGVYTTPQSITVNGVIPSDAVIHYTLDGTEPHSGSLVYNAPISLPLNTTTIMKVKAHKANWTASDTYTAVYNITGQVSMTQPVFSPEPGNFTSPIDVSINTLTIPAGSEIHYTTDGTNPDLTSPVYAGPIHIGNESQLLIKARAYKANWIPGEIYSGLFTVTGQVSPVTFNPGGGTYTAAQNVILTDATEGASIRYTTDGSEPSITSALYTTAINVPLNTVKTIRAKSFKAGWTNSVTTSETYTVTGQVALSTPIFNLAPGIYQSAQSVSITGIAFPSDATIRYSTDGSDPTIASAVYTTPIAIPLNTVMQIKVKAFKANWLPSDVYAGTYTITGQVALAQTLFSPVPGTFQTAQMVSIDTTTIPAGAVLRYTLDGTVPSESSPSYTTPISLSLNSNTTIRVRGYKTDWLSSNVTTGVYQVTGTVADVMFSVPGGTYQSSQEVVLSTTTSGATIHFTTDGSNPTEASTEYATPISIPLLSTMTIKAKAFKSSWASSGITTETYMITGQVVINQPVFNPAAGVYTTQQLVSINTPIPANAVVKYTTDGTDPTMSSATYSTPIVVPGSTSMVIKAKAFANNYAASNTETAIYNAYILPIPQFSPVSGTFTTAQNVTITIPVDDASIYYTTDGSEPTINSTLYTVPISVGLNTTLALRAKAFKDGWVPSQTANAIYIVTGQVAPVVFNPISGTYTTSQNVVLTTATEGASIRYTIDGSEPTIGSALYSTAINIPLNTVRMIKAKAFKTGWTTSVTTSETYTVTGQVTLATPIFNLNPGIYQVAQSLSVIGIAFPSDATIRYTTDGSDPTIASAVYSTPLAIPLNTVLQIKVKAFRTNWLPSETYSGTYTITGQVALPTTLFTPTPGIYQTAQTVSFNTNTLPTGSTLRYTLDGTVPSESSPSYTTPIALGLNSSTTIRVRGYKTDWVSSDVTTGVFQITGTVANVALSPQSGTYQSAQNVILSTTTNGATIRFTTDGTDPTETSTEYTAPIVVPLQTTMTVKAKAFKLNWNPSGITTETYHVTGQVVFNQPVFTPASGVYTTQQLVTINTTVPANAIVKYTTDGTDPTMSSATYTNPIVVPGSTSMVIKARAFLTDYAASNTETAIYNAYILPIPQFTPASGTYVSAQNVTISVPVSDAAIHYTTDGTEPNTNSNLYTLPITVGLNNTVLFKAKAFKTGWVPSQTASATYIVTGQVSPVVFNPLGGTYTNSQSVVLSTATEGASIRYTTNGSDPTIGSALYTTAINVPLNTSMVIKAKAFKTGWTTSATTSETYTITGQVTLSSPIFNIAPGIYQTPQTVSIVGTAYPSDAILRYTTDGSDPTISSPVYSSPIPIPLNSTVQIKVGAFKDNWISSTIHSGQFTVTGQVALSPSLFTPIPGIYQTAQIITIDTNTVPTGAILRYTLDGSVPNESSPSYTSPVALPLNSSATISVRGYKADWTPSAVVTGIYQITGTVADVTFNPNGGTYQSAQNVTLTTTTPGASIRYTTDGSNPSETLGTVYTGSINVTAGLTVKAIAYMTNWNSSTITSATYNFNVIEPVFNPLAGSYPIAQTVSLSTVTTGASIRYTVDGSNPSDTNGTLYTTPLTIAVSTNLKAIAFKAGWVSSNIVNAVYVINGAVSNPTFNPLAGTYNANQTVSITAFPSDAIIRYTTDGSIPSHTNGAVYNTPIAVNANVTIKAIAYKADWLDSGVSQATYNLLVENPVLSLPTGIYTTAQSLALTVPTVGAQIRYTIDGTNPSETTGTLYSAPIAINSTQVVRAIAYKNGWTTSSIVSGLYTITGQVADVSFNPLGGTYQTAQSVALSSVTTGATIRYTVDGSEPSEASASYFNAITIPLNTTMTIKAKAYKAGWTPSTTTQQTYVVTGQVALNQPVFTPPAGAYATAQTVTIGNPIPADATVRYTTDGTNPSTTIGTVYTGPINVAVGMTIKAIAYKTNWISSAISSATYSFNVIAPTFNPIAGSYPTAQSVTLATSTLGASIRFTVDGSNPSETNGTLYTTAINIAQSTNVKAIAYRTGWNSSSVVNAVYVINGAVANPAFNPIGGSYNNTQTVSISTFPLDATIRFTTDGSTPSHTVGTIYSTPIAVNVNTTIKAIAYKTDWLDSGVAQAAYVLQTGAPLLSLPSGTYSTAQTLTLTTPTTGAQIRYTTNGTNPSETVGTVYSAPIAINSTQTVKAIAYKAGWTSSSIITGDYIITGQVAAVTFNPLGGTFQSTQSVVLSTTTPGANIRYTTDGTEPSDASATFIFPIIVPLNTTMMIKAKAFKNGWDPSVTSQQTYVVTGQVVFNTPVFDPPVGVYTTAQVITVNTPVPADATVRYTTDGTEPTATSTQYTTSLQLPLNSSLNLKVKAFKNDWTASQTYTASYVATGQVAMTLPVYSPAPGLYTTPQQVSINTVTLPVGATVRYTLDGSDPSELSPQYTGPINVNNAESIVVRARSFYPNWIPSEIYTGNYTVTGQIVIPEPVFTPSAGTYTSVQVVTLNTSTTPSGAELRYTVDGNEPTQTSNLYTSAIVLPLNSVTTLKVKAFKTDWIASQTYSAIYTITGQVAFSGDLFTPTSGIYTTAQDVLITASVYPTAATIHYTTDGSEPTEASAEYTGPINVALNTSNLVIKAKAYYPSWVPSQTITSFYTVTGQVQLAAVPFSIPAGVYTTAQTVSGAPAVLPLNATIRYTTDGKEPTLDSPAFLSPLNLAENTITTLKIKGFANNWLPSETVEAVYTITGTIATPTFSHPTGIYSAAFTLVLQSATAGADIRYTLDGTEPSLSSDLYVDGINVPDMATDLTIKARAFKTNWIESATASETYSVLLLPINVRAFTYAGFIRVIWNSPLAGRTLDGFNIYRKRYDEASFSRLNTTPIVTTQNGEYYYDDYAIQANKSYQYNVTAIYDGVESNVSTTTTIEYQSQELTISDVSHAYPNPAVTSCKIKLVLSRNENVQITVSIFDFAGKKVQTLTVPTTNANMIEIPWDLKSSGGVKLGRGTYFARIVANDGTNRVEKVIKISVK